MFRNGYNETMNRSVVMEKMAQIGSMLHEEETKPKEERSEEKIRELMYAQMIQGLRLNTQRGRFSI